MRTVHIDASTRYDVLIGADLIDRAGALTAGAVKPCKCAIVADDTDLVTLLKLAANQGFKAGREFGVISYNDTPLKEILAGGITTLSTDFTQMGRTMAAMVRKPVKQVQDNPCQLVIRSSI